MSGVYGSGSLWLWLEVWVISNGCLVRDVWGGVWLRSVCICVEGTPDKTFLQKGIVGGTRTVDVHIRRLRSKIDSYREKFIETVWNLGYRFKDIHNTIE